MKAIHIVIALALAAGLAACGGSPYADPAPDATANEVPASATASPAAYSQYAGSIALSETGSPLGVDKVVPPTTETGEPIGVI